MKPSSSDTMNIVITGGCGFVGSNLALYFKTKYPNYQIHVLDSLKRRGSELNLPRLREAGITYVHGDIRNPEDLDSLPRADYIIDASAEPSVLAGVGSSRIQVVNNNLMGTVNCLEWATRNKSRFVFLSTSRVYPIEALENASFEEQETRFQWTDTQILRGISYRGIAEEFPMEGYRSLYGATKLSSELLIQEYEALSGISYVINRCGVISGPWQMGKVDQGVIILWLARHLFGGTLTYNGYGGKGKQVRDIVHVDDLCELIDMQVHDWEKSAGTVFNVGGGLENSISLLELTEKVQSITHNKIAISPSLEKRSADIRIYCTDNTKVQATFRWKPAKSIDAILEESHEWLVRHAHELRPILQ